MNKVNNSEKLGWIPAGQAELNEGDRVWVCVKYEDGTRSQAGATYHKDHGHGCPDWDVDWVHDIPFIVTHVHPLPELPEEE